MRALVYVPREFMGTNYYHRTNICPHCGRYEEKHIGKSSFGWTFNFRAHDDIRSWTDWQKVLQTPDTQIADEYGSVHTFEEFRKQVEAKADAIHNHAKEYPDGNFLDPEGHSFSDHEFS